MAKFKISLKVTGIELQIEGSRDDVPLMTQAAGQQLASLFMPASNVVEGEFVDATNQLPAPPPEPERKNSKRSSRQRSSSNGSRANNVTGPEAIDWVHDPSKWGSPKQEWSTADKAIWTLYVVSKERDLGEISAYVIVTTFNKHFREAGLIRVNNTNRDLGKAKGKSPALVGENTTEKPSGWFLTQAGIRRAEELVSQALGRTPSPPANSME